MTDQPRRVGRPATGTTPNRSVRIGDAWDIAEAIAKSNGEKIRNVIERALEAYIMEHTSPVLLDPEREANDNPAYLCGRLASVLHDLEYAATDEHTDWYRLFPQAIANGALSLRWAETHAPAWLKRLEVRQAAHYRSEIDRLTRRIGSPGVLAGAENGSLVSLGFFHQQAAADRATKVES